MNTKLVLGAVAAAVAMFSQGAFAQASAPTRAEVKAEAKASIAKAQAESEGIRLVNDAVAGSNPMLLQMRQLDVEKSRVERWNGAFPQMMLGNNPNILFTSQLPALNEPKR